MGAKDNIVFSERESPFPRPFNVERFPHVAPILAALSPEDPCRVVTNALAVDGTAQPAGTAEAAVAAAWDSVVDGLNSKS